MEPKDILNLLITVVLPIVIALVAPVLRMHLQQQAAAGKNAHLYQMAEVFVASAEQLFVENEDKLGYAMSFFKTYAQDRHIGLDDATARAFIEAAVNNRKRYAPAA